jgi:hypothetical protein
LESLTEESWLNGVERVLNELRRSKDCNAMPQAREKQDEGRRNVKGLAFCSSFGDSERMGEEKDFLARWREGGIYT